MKTRYLTSKLNCILQRFITLVIVLIILHLAQSLAHEIIQDIEISKRRSAAQAEERSGAQALSIADKIKQSSKRLLPDGTLHYVYTAPGPLTHKGGQRIEVYDVNEQMVWSGPTKPLPFKYLSWAQFRGHYYGYGETVSQGRIRRMHAITPEFSGSLIVPIKRGGETQGIWRYNPTVGHFAGYLANGGWSVWPAALSCNGPLPASH